MAGFDTRTNLNNNRFEQYNTDILSLSGTNNFYGNVYIKLSGDFYLDDGNQKNGYVLYSDDDGKGYWGRLVSGNSSGGTYVFTGSVTENNGLVQLVNDNQSPNINQYYGTDGSGNGDDRSGDGSGAGCDGDYGSSDGSGDGDDGSGDGSGGGCDGGGDGIVVSNNGNGRDYRLLTEVLITMVETI